MKKHILQFSLSLAIFSLIFLILTPYFTSDFLDLRQQKENEENYQTFLREEEARLREEEARKIAEKEAVERIYLMGKFDPAQREDFILIPSEYALTPNKMYLRKETLDAFLKMQTAALQDKVNLKIASATRNFDYQKDLWNKKWTGETIVDGKNLKIAIPDEQERFQKILEYSAVPGASRHHWGTDIDINGAIPAYFNSGKGVKEYEWLEANAHLFGFCQTYNEKDSDRPAGYNEEKWHWSYLPLSKDFTQRYKELIKDEDIKEFLGEEYAPSLNLIKNYVLSISLDCV